MHPRYLLAMSTLLFAAPAIAQDYSGLQAKIDRLERDLTFLQRQVYQGDPNSSATSTPAGAGAGAATVQFGQIQEQMRTLQGQFEQIDYRIRKLEDDQRKRAEDTEYRLQQLEQKALQPAAPVAEPAPTPAEPEPVAPAPAAPAAPVKTPAVEPSNNGYDINASDPSAARTKSSAQYEPAANAGSTAPKGFANAKEHYNYAFKLLNDAKYADAAASFDSFVTKYPKDGLVANAYYWQGESYYARRDYAKAAEGFRNGYEAAPKGQKAPDNLLKLSLSLANLKRTKEACIVLKQVTAQYGTTAKTTAAKADSEYKRLNCA